MTRVLRALLRADLRYFIWKVFATVCPGEPYLRNWHIEAIAHQLMRVDSLEVKRLLINQPPRSLKSLCVSVAYVAWLLGHDPSRRIIVVSYSGEFASELHRQFRMVVEAKWYEELFPTTRWARKTEVELVTEQEGSRFATSIGGTLTGRGADLIVIDDPLNANEAASESARKRVNDWYTGALVSRLNDKEKGAIIAVMQRLHEDDLAGHLLSQGGWEHLNLPAIAIEDEFVAIGDGKMHHRKRGEVLHRERESMETLQSIKAEIGTLLFSSQYLQQPVPIEGNLIRRSWFRTYDALPAGGVVRVVQSWDVAAVFGPNNDYSVCTTWHVRNNDGYLAHVYRGRLEYPDLRRKIVSLAMERPNTTVLIEYAGPSMYLLQDLQSNTPLGMMHPIPIKPQGSKIDRMATQAAKIEAGHVYLPKDAPWLAEFLSELLSFPNGRHDDQVDSVSQFLLWLQQSYPSYVCYSPIIVRPGVSYYELY